MTIDLELDEEFKAWWSLPWHSAQSLPRDDSAKRVAAVAFAAGQALGVREAMRETMRDDAIMQTTGENVELSRLVILLQNELKRHGIVPPVLQPDGPPPNERITAQPGIHPSYDVSDAFRRMQNAIVSWERGTGRDSLLIFREAAGHIAEHGPMPSAIVVRLDNGILLDPANSDLDDAFLLRRFTDSIQPTTEAAT